MMKKGLKSLWITPIQRRIMEGTDRKIDIERQAKGKKKNNQNNILRIKDGAPVGYQDKIKEGGKEENHGNVIGET